MVMNRAEDGVWYWVAARGVSRGGDRERWVRVSVGGYPAWDGGGGGEGGAIEVGFLGVHGRVSGAVSMGDGKSMSTKHCGSDV